MKNIYSRTISIIMITYKDPKLVLSNIIKGFTGYDNLFPVYNLLVFLSDKSKAIAIIKKFYDTLDPDTVYTILPVVFSSESALTIKSIKLNTRLSPEDFYFYLVIRFNQLMNRYDIDDLEYNIMFTYRKWYVFADVNDMKIEDVLKKLRAQFQISTQDTINTQSTVDASTQDTQSDSTQDTPSDITQDSSRNNINDLGSNSKAIANINSFDNNLQWTETYSNGYKVKSFDKYYLNIF
ncbi:hypothetical protein BB561_002388 [Smittium simulii]|uniref:Uncharacterized protein n=1 Tax=Smittium simulii TaxID=133385 RepID=A0A2T9YQQ9_9FUNG|nr:hypothetical protein BB561_002388 [Smittium simulii]